MDRDPKSKASSPRKPDDGSFASISWEELERNPLLLEGVEGIVNLAGESINQLWTDAAKKRINASRVEAAERLKRIISGLPRQPNVWINASGVNAYGNSLTDTFTEESPMNSVDFLSSVVRDWEQAASGAPAARTVFLRIGIVLDRDGGALPKMLLPFRLLAGGPLGSGNQWISWIHLQDIVRLISFLLTDDSVSGPVNASAPQPVTNEQFGRAAASTLRKPYWIKAPSPALKLVLGEMSALLLEGQRVLPAKALEAGFKFQFETIELPSAICSGPSPLHIHIHNRRTLPAGEHPRSSACTLYRGSSLFHSAWSRFLSLGPWLGSLPYRIPAPYEFWISRRTNPRNPPLPLLARFEILRP